MPYERIRQERATEAVRIAAAVGQLRAQPKDPEVNAWLRKMWPLSDNRVNQLINELRAVVDPGPALSPDVYSCLVHRGYADLLEYPTNPIDAVAWYTGPERSIGGLSTMHPGAILIVEETSMGLIRVHGSRSLFGLGGSSNVPEQIWRNNPNALVVALEKAYHHPLKYDTHHIHFSAG